MRNVILNIMRTNNNVIAINGDTYLFKDIFKKYNGSWKGDRKEWAFYFKDKEINYKNVNQKIQDIIKEIHFFIISNGKYKITINDFVTNATIIIPDNNYNNKNVSDIIQQYYSFFSEVANNKFNDRTNKYHIYNYQKETFLKYINTNKYIDNSETSCNKIITVLMLIKYLIDNKISNRIIISTNGIGMYYWQDEIQKWLGYNSIIVENQNDHPLKYREIILEMSKYLDYVILIMNNKSVFHQSGNGIEFIKNLMFEYDTSIIIDEKLIDSNQPTLYKNLTKQFSTLLTYSKYFLYLTSIDIKSNLNYINNVVNIYYPKLINYYKDEFVITENLYKKQLQDEYIIKNINMNVYETQKNNVVILDCINKRTKEEVKMNFIPLNKSIGIYNSFKEILNIIQTLGQEVTAQNIYISDDQAIPYILKMTIMTNNEYYKTYMGIVPDLPLQFYDIVYKYKNINNYIAKITKFYSNSKIENFFAPESITQNIIRKKIYIPLNEKQIELLINMKQEIVNNMSKKNHIYNSYNFSYITINSAIEYAFIQNKIKKIKDIIADPRNIDVPEINDTNINDIDIESKKILYNEKIQKILQIIKDIQKNSRKDIKLIILTQYKKMVNYIEEDLKDFFMRNSIRDKINITSIPPDVIDNSIKYNIFQQFKERVFNKNGEQQLSTQVLSGNNSQGNNNDNNFESNVQNNQFQICNIDILIMRDEINLPIDFADVIIYYDIHWNTIKHHYREVNATNMNNLINKKKQVRCYLINDIFEKEIFDLIDNNDKKNCYDMQYIYYLITEKVLLEYNELCKKFDKVGNNS